MGNSSATFPGDFCLNLALSSRDHSDDPLGTYTHYQHCAFKAIHYDGFSSCGRLGGAPRSLAPSDHTLIDVDPCQLMDLKPLAHLLGNPLDPQSLSDHAPLMAIIRQEVVRPAVQRGWPMWLAETPRASGGHGCSVCRRSHAL